MRRGKRAGYMHSSVVERLDSGLLGGWIRGYMHAWVGAWVDCWIHGCTHGLMVNSQLDALGGKRESWCFIRPWLSLL